MFQTGLIPPNANLEHANPAIKWQEYKLRVPRQPEPLSCRRATGRPLVAMTSSGIGGANGHCVVEGPPKLTDSPSTFWHTAQIPFVSIVIAGGLSPRSTSAVAASLQQWIPGRNSQSVSRIYGRRSRSMPWRSFSVITDGESARFSDPILAPKTRPPVVFIFCGQGAQHMHSM